MPDPLPRLAVIGTADHDEHLADLAFEVGYAIARSGSVLLCGGRSGVMEAAARGAREGGGQCVGILPGVSARDTPPNRWVDLPIYTGMGQARNQILVLSADAVIGIGGGWGTLTEIGLALKHGIPVILLESWELERPDGRAEPQLERAHDPGQAVALALAASSTESALQSGAT